MRHCDKVTGVDEDSCASLSLDERTIYVLYDRNHPGPRVGRPSVTATYMQQQ